MNSYYRAQPEWESDRDRDPWRPAPPEQRQPQQRQQPQQYGSGAYRGPREPQPWGEDTQQLSGPWQAPQPRRGERPAQYQQQPPPPPYHQAPYQQYPPRYQQAPYQQYPPQYPQHQYQQPQYPQQQHDGPPGGWPTLAEPPRKRRRGWAIVGSIFTAIVVSIVIFVVKTGVRETFDEDANMPDVLLEYTKITDLPELVAEADKIAQELARDNDVERDRIALAYYRLKTDPPTSPAKLLVAEAVGKVDVAEVRAGFAAGVAAEGFPAAQEYPADIPDSKILCTAGTIQKVQMSACQWVSANHFVEVYFITGTLDEHRPLFLRIRAALAES